MVTLCENYAKEHDLIFSTDPDPKKCKTKYLAFLKKRRDLPNIQLFGDSLPWVTSGINLGNHLDDKVNGMKQDILVKRANSLLFSL